MTDYNHKVLIKLVINKNDFLYINIINNNINKLINIILIYLWKIILIKYKDFK